MIGVAKEIQRQTGVRFFVLLALAYAVYFGWDSIPQISRSVAASVAHPGLFLSRLQTPRAGEEFPLPVGDLLVPEALESAKLIHGAGVPNYSVTPVIYYRSFPYYQIMEEAWPSREESNSRYKLIYAHEQIPAGCTVLATEKEMRLLDCHR